METAIIVYILGGVFWYLWMSKNCSETRWIARLIGSMMWIILIPVCFIGAIKLLKEVKKEKIKERKDKKDEKI